MEVSATQLAELYGVDDRTITNWVNEDPACPSAKRKRLRVFDTVAVAEWFAERRARQAVAKVQKQAPTDEKDARRRKLMAEAILAEIAVREKEGELIPADVHEDVCGQLADRMRAVCINAPSNYSLDLERAGVPAAQAQELLEKIADDLTRALRGVVDQVVDEDESEAA